MKSRRKLSKMLTTDKQTDYLFEYFINEDKFDDQLKSKWNEELEKKVNQKLKDENVKLDSRVSSDKKSNSSEELPSHTIGVSNQKEKKNEMDFEESDSSSSSKEASSLQNNQVSASEEHSSEEKSSGISDKKSSEKPKTKTPYLKKIDPRPVPILGDKLIENPIKFEETPEERRARQRTAYMKLKQLVKQNGIVLTKTYTMDSDPNEMEEEVKLHTEMRHRENSINFYKRVLLNIVIGVEFLNERYDPFSFKLRNWHDQVAADMDEYAEILEELYDKYKGKGGKFPPEVKLILLLLFSGITYHASQVAMNSNPNSISNIIKNNSGLINGFVKQAIIPKNNEDVPAGIPNNEDILKTIRSQNKQNNTKTEDRLKNPAYSEEKQKQLLEEQRRFFENKLKEQNEMYSLQLEQLKRQANQQKSFTSPSGPSLSQRFHPQQNESRLGSRPQDPFQENPQLRPHVPQENMRPILRHDDPRTKPLNYQEKPVEINSRDQRSEESDIFSPSKQTPEKQSEQKKEKKELDEIIDSLGSNISVSDIEENTPKKDVSSKKPPNMTPHHKQLSTSTTKKTRTDSKRSNVVKL
jgi:hypothetical protein